LRASAAERDREGGAGEGLNARAQGWSAWGAGDAAATLEEEVAFIHRWAQMEHRCVEAWTGMHRHVSLQQALRAQSFAGSLDSMQSPRCSRSTACTHCLPRICASCVLVCG